MIAPARRAAYEVLRATSEGDMDLPGALARERDGLQDPRDRALAGEIVLGVLRWRAALDAMIERLARRPVERLDPEVRDILRAGLYQLWRLERVPPSAVVNDAVALTRVARRGRAAALVNATLRGFARTTPDRLLPSPERTAAYLSVVCSHPRWIVDRWLARFGYDAVEQWLRFNNAAAPLTLRVNTSRTDAATLRSALAAEGVIAHAARYAPDALVVERGQPLGSRLFATGHFIVQDEASQLVAHMAGVQPGERVLDACASPGGKTLVLSNALRGGILVSADVRARRVALLAETIRRTGAAAVIVQMDLRQPAPFATVFDCVLVDAPCSGLGTVRRDPDIKWRRLPDDLHAFAAVQRVLLRHAADVVRPGGRVVYATCSSEPEENEEVVDEFLRERAELFSEPAVRRPGPLAAGPLAEVRDTRGRLRTLPHVHGLEAFFAAVLVKAEPV